MSDTSFDASVYGPSRRNDFESVLIPGNQLSRFQSLNQSLAFSQELSPTERTNAIVFNKPSDLDQDLIKIFYLPKDKDEIRLEEKSGGVKL